MLSVTQILVLIGFILVILGYSWALKAYIDFNLSLIEENNANYPVYQEDIEDIEENFTDWGKDGSNN